MLVYGIGLSPHLLCAQSESPICNKNLGFSLLYIYTHTPMFYWNTIFLYNKDVIFMSFFRIRV